MAAARTSEDRPSRWFWLGWGKWSCITARTAKYWTVRLCWLWGQKLSWWWRVIIICWIRGHASALWWICEYSDIVDGTAHLRYKAVFWSVSCHETILMSSASRYNPKQLDSRQSEHIPPKCRQADGCRLPSKIPPGGYSDFTWPIILWTRLLQGLEQPLGLLDWDYYHLL